jgi:transposase
MHDRHDLTDEQWALLEPRLPRCGERGGRPWRDHRQVIDGVLWRTRTGCTWRDVPATYGHWKTVYNRHRRWAADGTWDALLAELQRGCDTEFEEWSVGVDSTVIRAHQDAAGAPHAAPRDVPAERLAIALDAHAAGRSSRHTGG